jgi:hypothetical protein
MSEGNSWKEVRWLCGATGSITAFEDGYEMRIRLLELGLWEKGDQGNAVGHKKKGRMERFTCNLTTLKQQLEGLIR